MDTVDFKKLRKSFTELVESANNIKTKNLGLKPVFAEVPAAFKNFATQITGAVADLKAKLTFDFLDLN